jgi:O-antigen ligase
VLTVPINLLPYGLLLLPSTAGAGAAVARAGMAGQPVKVLVWLMLAVLALGVLSVVLFEQGLRDVDNRSRFVVIPWIALWICALRPSLRWLWYGSLTGLLATFVMSLWQVLGGPRAELFTNAIVLADIVMV